jgi:membrane protein DedA with SNARE-associated domain
MFGNRYLPQNLQAPFRLNAATAVTTPILALRSTHLCVLGLSRVPPRYFGFAKRIGVSVWAEMWMSPSSA